MGPIQHLICSTALAAAEYAVTKDKALSITSFFSGFMVDIDHLVEYKAYLKKKRWNWKEFFSGSYFDKKGTICVLFHSWELAIAAGIGSIALPLCGKNRKSLAQSIVQGFFLGYTSHLILDFFGNDLKKPGYFWMYRYKNNWSIKKLLAKDDKK